MSLLHIQRVPLTNGIPTEITTPTRPFATARVTVINLTGAALRVYSVVADSTAYLEIQDGFSWTFDLIKTTFPNVSAFHLLAGANGTAVLVWL